MPGPSAIPPDASAPLCQRCGRQIRGDAARCVVCGWTEDAELQLVEQAGRTRRERFQAWSTFWPFVIWGVSLGLVAAVLLPSALASDAASVDGAVAWASVLLAVFLGPVVSTARLAQRQLVWVGVDPEAGLDIAGQRKIEWDEIAGVLHEPGPLAYHGTLESLSDKLPRGIVGMKLSTLVLPFLLVYLVIVPVLVELSPWGAHDTVILRSGERIVLRDLERGARFSQVVRDRLETVVLRAAA